MADRQRSPKASWMIESSYADLILAAWDILDDGEHSPSVPYASVSRNSLALAGATQMGDDEN